MRLHTSVQPSHLTVQYQHTHEGDGPLYLYNHLFDWFGILSGDLTKGAALNPTLPPTSALAAVYAHGPDGVLLEQGMPAPTRPGISAFAPRIPLCQRLLPGETSTVTLRLPLPLDEWHPNDAPTPARSHAGLVHTLTMKVVVAEERHATLVREHPTYRGLYNVSAHPRGELRAAVALDAPVTLRRRTDPIYRAT
jgi:hypothetical protein